MEKFRFRPHEDVVGRRFADSMVLVNLNTNRIFELNETGARFWDFVSEGTTPAEAAERLLREYDVPAEQLAAEVEDLMARLTAGKLLIAETGRC